MKQIICLVLAFSSGIAYAQKLNEKDVPMAVKEQFSKKVPDAKSVKWEKEDNEFEAEFTADTKRKSASFDASGQWLETEMKMKESEVPNAVLATVKKELPDYKLEKAESVDTPDGSFYEVEVESNEVKYELKIDRDAKLLEKKEKQKQKEHDKD